MSFGSNDDAARAAAEDVMGNPTELEALEDTLEGLAHDDEVNVDEQLN